ncbi:MAG: preprotein translocase subunit SecG [Candidatus Zambryskibacteria bacterium RIFCSPHIGHO2_02_FULL_43_14]|uniref:Protein-export membrane protein SecG n=1 Tax=Candidatus Zambryskibacteria bacterium RIFCSPHIGHO2_02_FULL_43_14 TaxID=1802748 RepID=A0A1G2TJ10_9BACT|nr:MAG: preprotein translocase subunit SecG [Candidatus Zambryskibacteria bacterium RIFCSPHIGHO2_01_FULL_43_60]OHA96649.1 MAG: preprotein translocase subunit SecG [Candidatus Zambryskibacteria bacterium RIFCSPHIGHO2_02_FULL_43_14]OHB04009.1 MAG: preprotein translocase subunit SecG [Candidatus Zambryskibacteria bacterium RIFCSPLOWO2_01_FULL_42_41]
MIQILPYIQIVLSLLLVAGVLLQRSEESLGSAFGSDGAAGGRFMRRGFEKILFNATLVVAVLFILSAFANLLIGR